MRLQLHALHQRILLVIDILRQRNIEHRTRRPAQAEAGELGVPHDAHDAKRAGILRQIQAEVLPQRIFVALEEALHKRFVDDRDRLGGFVVGRGKSTARATRVTPKF